MTKDESKIKAKQAANCMQQFQMQVVTTELKPHESRTN